MCFSSDEPQRPKTQCEHHRDNILNSSPDGYPVVGVFVPQCDADGQYMSQQVRLLFLYIQR